VLYASLDYAPQAGRFRRGRHRADECEQPVGFHQPTRVEFGRALLSRSSERHLVPQTFHRLLEFKSGRSSRFRERGTMQWQKIVDLFGSMPASSYILTRHRRRALTLRQRVLVRSQVVRARKASGRPNCTPAVKAATGLRARETDTSSDARGKVSTI
jgi:hypothetical protein